MARHRTFRMKLALEGRLLWTLAVGAAVALSCAQLKEGDPGSSSGPAAPDGGTTPDGASGNDVDGSSSLPDGSSPKGDSGVGPAKACRKIPIDCLDPAPANVIEVTTESSMSDAVANAKSNDTIQIRGKTLGAGWRVPAYVTLRGCEGAKIDGHIAFAGSGGVIEGFEVRGTIVANTTGSYIVRYNRFVTGAANEAGVSGRSIDSLVSASVTLVVDSNVFESRDVGVEARTSYDTLTHAVDITVRNNAFVHVVKPFIASESGIVGVIAAKLEQNSFYDFGTAIGLYNVDRKSTTSGNLFVKGSKGIEGSAYDVAYSFAWQVTTPAATPPVSGAFATGDPSFVNADAGDLRLGPSSAVVDRIPNGVVVPAEDYLGCPRPSGAPGAPAQSDVGAFESQP